MKGYSVEILAPYQALAYLLLIEIIIRVAKWLYPIIWRPWNFRSKDHLLSFADLDNFRCCVFVIHRIVLLLRFRLATQLSV